MWVAACVCGLVMGLNRVNQAQAATSVCGVYSSKTVESVLKDHPIGNKNVVSQHRLPLVTGSVVLKCRSFCQECGLSRQVVSHGSGLSRQVSL